jgi:cobalt-zinc-cadmium efflux system membrane fusion protein
MYSTTHVAFWGFGLILIFLSAVVVGAWHSSVIELPSTKAVGKMAHPVVALTARDVNRVVTARGTVDYEPEQKARLSARASGTIWRVYKEIGDTVHKGDVLALIDAEKVGKAKADFLLDYTQFELRDKTLARMRSLAANLAGKDVQIAEADQREARVRLFNDRQALLNFGLSIHLADIADLSDIDRIRFMRVLGLPDDLRQTPDAETLTANLLPLIAPFDGRVVERNATMGEIVQTSQPQALFVVADLRRLQIKLDVSPVDIARVRIGQSVTFRPDVSGSEISGVVSHISPEVDAKTRHIRVRAKANNPDELLRPNTFGTGSIVL